MTVKIDNYLNELTGLVKISNKAGKFDINKHSENRAINLFNLVYGFDLKNANKILSDNFPAIDLIDNEAGVVIQVTATNTDDKIEYTLEKFIEKNLHLQYSRVIIYILTDKPLSYTNKKLKKFKDILNGRIEFDVKKDILDNKDLAKEINNIDNIKHLKSIYEYLELELSNSSENRTIFQKELNAFAKYNIEDLLGREKTLENIHEKFSTHNLVLLQGTGGIGKTAIAKSYLEKHRNDYTHLAYIDVNETLPSAIFNKLGIIDKSYIYDYEVSTAINIENLINKLFQIKNTLLIIDNCNNEDELRQWKNEISKLNWKILITSRALPPDYTKETITITHLEPELAYTLFKNNCNRNIDNEKDVVFRILEKIKYHTKLTIILAKAAYNNPLLKLEELADRVSQEIYNEEKINVLISLDTEENYVYEFLLLLFKPEELDKDLQRYLKYFSILPNQEISVELLVQMYERNAKQGYFINLINKLIFKGWIERYENYYRIHPIIQLVTKEKLSISVISCQNLIDNLTFYLSLSNNFIENSIYLEYGVSIVDFFENENHDKIGVLANYVGCNSKLRPLFLSLK